MTWEIYEDREDPNEIIYVVSNGSVEFATLSEEGAKWLCKLCNWITEDEEK